MYTLIYRKITSGAATMFNPPHLAHCALPTAPWLGPAGKAGKRENTEKTQCNINAGGEEGKRENRIVICGLQRAVYPFFACFILF